MKIYFACSITGGRRDESIYRQLVDVMLDSGHEVPTAMLAGPDVVALENVVDPDEVYARDVAWIESSDMLVAEVSTPSHGVGYEIGYALSLGKPVLCLHKAGTKISKMILGNPDSNLTVRAYKTPAEAVDLLREVLSQEV